MQSIYAVIAASFSDISKLSFVSSLSLVFILSTTIAHCFVLDGWLDYLTYTLLSRGGVSPRTTSPTPYD